MSGKPIDPYAAYRPESDERFAERMALKTHGERIDQAVELLGDLYGGGGEYGIYAKAIESRKLRVLLGMLLPPPAQSHQTRERK